MILGVLDTVSQQCVEFTGMGLFEKNQKWSLTTSCGQLTTFGRLKKSGIEYVILEGSSLFAWSGSGQELSPDICRVWLPRWWLLSRTVLKVLQASSER